jgi:hypothetical protein
MPSLAASFEAVPVLPGDDVTQHCVSKVKASDGGLKVGVGLTVRNAGTAEAKILVNMPGMLAVTNSGVFYVKNNGGKIRRLQKGDEVIGIIDER